MPMKLIRINRRLVSVAMLLLLVAIAIPIIILSVKSCNSTPEGGDIPTLALEHSWYFKPREDGLQPLPMGEAPFVKNYKAYYVGSPDEKIIYLTFDAGYENGYTANILDVLKKHNVHAAFFLTGHYVKTRPDLVRRMVAEGHLVCNHTMNHKKMSRLFDFEAFKKELTDIEGLYRQVTGQEMACFFRPPEGAFTELTLKYAQELGYTTVFWSFAYADWMNDKQPSHEYAFSKIFPRTHPGEIALLHATSRTNAEILDAVLTEWENRGYRFESLDHLVQTVPIGQGWAN